MKEIVVISGKGGTGKTSLVASFAILAKKTVIADCDVDAADLHLVLTPDVKAEHDFLSGYEAFIEQDVCTACGACLNLCRFGAIDEMRDTTDQPVFRINPIACEGCRVCARFCPHNAVEMKKRLCGAWMVSETRAGPMVHARLGIAAENSGKLVALVRQEARRLAQEKKRDTVLIDGPPGIGCPVIASITGASQIIIVTEPTMSAAHDLERVLELAKHFKVPSFVCVNKWDICPDMAAYLEEKAVALNARVLGRIRYDRAVTQAQKIARAVIETEASCNEDILEIWNKFQQLTEKERTS